MTLPTRWILVTGIPFAGKIGVAIGRGREEQVGKLVGDQPVDLLGHGAVERAQPGFHVADTNASLAQTRAAATVELTSP